MVWDAGGACLAGETPSPTSWVTLLMFGNLPLHARLLAAVAVSLSTVYLALHREATGTAC